MNRIERRFQDLAERNETAFIPFITAGDPTLAITGELVLEFEKAGADIIEFGVPYTDPLAGGPGNQEGAPRPLEHHLRIADILALVKTLREKTEIPILLFTYYNPVLAYGVDRLAADSKEAGVDGILCVDLPPEEAGAYEAAFGALGLSTVFLLAPTSTDDRIDLIAEHSTGFVYYVSRTGTTGERETIESSVKGMVAKIKTKTDTPVAVGFGISTPAQAREIAGYGDGVVVGSAIVRMIGELGDSPDTPAKVGAFVKSLADAAKGRA
ncbi:MAG: tryptophan synthase subunit alpha [Candidatus Hydrogenedentes bacterium]|nr:tryptophan synthase subunit alpha [Candidatus Hydrogenedentota bacterium]